MNSLPALHYVDSVFSQGNRLLCEKNIKLFGNVGRNVPANIDMVSNFGFVFLLVPKSIFAADITHLSDSLEAQFNMSRGLAKAK